MVISFCNNIRHFSNKKAKVWQKKMKRQIQGNEATFLLITLDHFWLENQIQWEKLSRKNTHIYFSYFWFKNKWVWEEKIRKKTKKFQKPKSCRQLPQHLIHTAFQIFHMENQDNQLLVLQLLKIISGSK